MADTKALKDALKAMKDGSGDFAAVLAAAETAVWEYRMPKDEQDLDDYEVLPDSFEDTVTKAYMQRVIDREQWRQLRDIWKR